ncbi:hypothetical protein V6N13_116613 [Hibiscus sabdariffa]
MIPNKAQWDITKVWNVFSNTDAQIILGCPIVRTQEEIILWEGHSSGVYNTRASYNWIKRNQATQEHAKKIWTSIKNLRTLPKIKIFAWKLCYEALITGNILLNAGLGDGICKMYDQTIETTIHAFRDCPLTREVLKTYLLINLMNSFYCSGTFGTDETTECTMAPSRGARQPLKQLRYYNMSTAWLMRKKVGLQ